MDPQTLAWLDQEDEHVAQVIRKHGWMIENVGAGWCGHPGCEKPAKDESPFAYTVGLFGVGHPELLVFSLDPASAGAVLNDLGSRVKAGQNFVAGQLVTFDGWQHRAVLEIVPNPGEIVFSANRHYRRPAEVSVPVLQVTYDDLRGRFPWEDGYANPPHVQPRPGTFRA